MRRVSAVRGERAAIFTLTRVEERKEDKNRRCTVLYMTENKGNGGKDK